MIDEKTISNGVASGIVWAVTVIFFLTFMLMLILSIGDYDTTDPNIGRSGLELHIDNLTGCHYLSTNGGLIKRTTSDGIHICDQ